MLERLQKVIKNVAGRDDIVITSRTRLNNEEFNFSSFALIQMVCAIEDEFDIEISNSAIKKFKTVGDVVKYLEENAE